EGYIAPNGQKLMEKRGIEVGNIFQLGFHYSSKMKGAAFVDAAGKSKPYYMGCYGIGIARTMAAIVEVSHDEKGIVWPESIAPYQAHLVGLSKKADEVYEKLQKTGIEVLYDDRDGVSAGAKFADADLIGIPVRLVVSEKTGDKVEWKKRTGKETELLTFEDVVSRLTSLS